MQSFYLPIIPWNRLPLTVRSDCEIAERVLRGIGARDESPFIAGDIFADGFAAAVTGALPSEL